MKYIEYSCLNFPSIYGSRIKWDLVLLHIGKDFFFLISIGHIFWDLW